MAWERRKVKILGFSLLSIISPRFLGVSENSPAMEFYYCAYCCLCLSECIFSWVESQVLRAGAKEKKMKVYFVLYKCWEVLAIFFSVIFFSLLKVTEVSINFYWNVLGVLWNAFTPALPKCLGGWRGWKIYIPLLPFSSTPFPAPNIKIFLLEGASTNQSRWCHLNCWGGRTSFKRAV